jgi:GNAT superfamily N-acetyltransferase
MHELDNIAWMSLTGSHARFATGTDAARRYGPGFSPIAAFPNPEQPNLDALSDYCVAGEHLYVGGWSAMPSPRWHVDSAATMYQMVWQGALPTEDAAAEAVQLTTEHAALAVELTTLTQPGPFGPRTIELGDYFGIVDRGRLVAMAGERMYAGSMREISGVCTHPDFQGRGLARRLMLKLIRRQMLRGEAPFLHVMRDNTNAHRLYERMGFVDRRELAVGVVSCVY